MRLCLIVSTVMILLLGCRSSSDIESSIASLNKPGPDIQVLLYGDRFQNTRAVDGKAYLYNATFYAVISERDTARMENEFSNYAARNSQSITEIMARASAEMLNDPKRMEIRQSILDMCQERFGLNSDGVPYIRGIVITEWSRTEIHFPK